MVKNNYQYIFLFIFYTCFFLSCKQKQVTPDEYLEWYKKNKKDLIIRKEIGDLWFEAEYTPIDYLILKQLNYNGEFDKDSFLTIKKDKENMEYFIYRIGLKNNPVDLLNYNLTDKNEYFSRIQYYSFYFKDNIRLITDKDSLSCNLSLFERTYGLTPYLTLNIMFNKTQNIKTEKIIEYEDVIFNSGKIKILFNKKIFKNIPTIKIK